MGDLAHQRDHVPGGLALEVRVVAQERQFVAQGDLHPGGVGATLQAEHRDSLYPREMRITVLALLALPLFAESIAPFQPRRVSSPGGNHILAVRASRTMSELEYRLMKKDGALVKLAGEEQFWQ